MILDNPYEVLGVSQDATDVQIKEAYRNLAKKYHPDNYADSPLKDVAEQKMKEINEAYDTINDMRKGRGKYKTSQNYGDAYGNYSSGTYGGYQNDFGGYSNAYTQTKFPDVRRLIQMGRLDDALQLLDGIAPELRDGEWNFLMGMIYYRKGFSEQAYSFFQTAYELNPDNPEFSRAYQNMNRQRNKRVGDYNTTATGCSSCDICSGIMCADCCCRCMGGDGICC